MEETGRDRWVHRQARQPSRQQKLLLAATRSSGRSLPGCYKAQHAARLLNFNARHLLVGTRPPNTAPHTTTHTPHAMQPPSFSPALLTWGAPTSHSTLNSRRNRSTMISRCSSPMPSITVWLVSSSRLHGGVRVGRVNEVHGVVSYGTGRWSRDCATLPKQLCCHMVLM